MSKHTPGPWVNGWGGGLTGPTTPNISGATCGEASANRRREAGDEYVQTSRPVSCGKETIAIVPENGDGEANARLIAAAPDLLEACELASRRIDTEISEIGLTPEDSDLPECLARLRAAIAKATGGEA